MLVKSIASLGREPSLLKPAQGFLLILSEAGEILLPFQGYNSVGFSVQRSKPVRKGDCCCGSPFQRLLSIVAWPHVSEPDIMEVQGHRRAQLSTSSEQEGQSKRKWPGVLHLTDPPPFVGPDSSSLGKLHWKPSGRNVVHERETFLFQTLQILFFSFFLIGSRLFSHVIHPNESFLSLCFSQLLPTAPHVPM